MKAAVTTLVLLAGAIAGGGPALAQDFDAAHGPNSESLVTAGPLFADPRIDHPAFDASAALSAAPLPLPKYGAWVGITKWATLAASVGLGALGFVLHEDANDTFDRLNTLCMDDPDNCRSRNPNGTYSDPRLERLYQNVLDKDNQARWSLIGAEVSFGVSVILFIVDFQRSRRPSDIPYDPDEEKNRLRLSATPGELAVRYYLR